MENKQLTIARHGETENNQQGKSRGWNMDSLDRTGKNQAKTLALKLAKNGVDHIISSDLPRAKQTAEIIARQTGAKVKTDPELRTWNIGKYTGKKTKDIESILEKAKAHPNIKLPEGESYNNFKKRADKGLLKAKEEKGNKVVVVHNEVAKLLDLKLKPGKSTTGFLK